MGKDSLVLRTPTLSSQWSCVHIDLGHGLVGEQGGGKQTLETNPSLGSALQTEGQHVRLTGQRVQMEPSQGLASLSQLQLETLSSIETSCHVVEGVAGVPEAGPMALAGQQRHEG